MLARQDNDPEEAQHHTEEDDSRLDSQLQEAPLIAKARSSAAFRNDLRSIDMPVQDRGNLRHFLGQSGEFFRQEGLHAI